MAKSKPIQLTELRRLRRIHDITLEEVEKETGVSLGYLNLIERGIKKDVKSEEKRKVLENYIRKLRRKKPKII